MNTTWPKERASGATGADSTVVGLTVATAYDILQLELGADYRDFLSTLIAP